MHTLRRIGLAGFVLLLTLTACADDDQGATADTNAGYIGAVEGTDAFIAIGVLDRAAGADEAVIYVCNGDEEIAEWFRGTVEDPTDFRFTNAAGATVSAEFGGNSFDGDFVTVDGTTYGFNAVAITGDGGVYRTTGPEAEAEGIVAVWIIDNDGDERGAILRRGSFLRTTSFSRTFTFGGLTFPVVKVVEMNGIIAPNN